MQSPAKEICRYLLKNVRSPNQSFLQNLSFNKEQCSRSYYMTPECKVALITGGSEGMGFAVANHFLKEGAKGVAVTGLNKCHGHEAIKCLNGQYGRNKAMFVNANTNCLAELEETFRVTKEAYENIDIVVNCCAVCDGSKWENEIVTNVVGSIRTLLLAYKYVGKEGHGRGGCVINFSGIGGLEPMVPVPTLSCSFHAIVGLSRSFGGPNHFNASGVRVTCLCPGITNTRFFAHPNEQAMTPKLGTELKDLVTGGESQIADMAGLAAIEMVKWAESGSVWVLEGSKLYECKIPNWNTYSKLKSQFI